MNQLLALTLAAISLGIYLVLANRTELARHEILTYPKQSASFAGAYARFGRYQLNLWSLTVYSIALMLLHPVGVLKLYFALMAALWRLTWLSDFRWEANSSLRRFIHFCRRIRAPIGN